MTTSSNTSQDSEFSDMIQNTIILERVDVGGLTIEFDTGALYTTVDIERIDASPFLEWVAENFNVDEIFEEGLLESWAEDNGYTKEEQPE